MAEQQLVDYIKKVKAAGQTDEQIRAALYPNGWTEAEVNDAFAAIDQPQVQVRPQQPQPQPEITQPVSQPEPRYEPQSFQDNMPKAKSSHMILKLLVVLIILVVIGGAGYFAIGQEGLISSFLNKFIPATSMQTQTKSSGNTNSPATPVANQQTALPVVPPTPPVTAWCYTFTKNLGYADSGTNDIVQLHTALQKEGFSYSPDGDNVYADATSQAVIQFQTKYGISPASGFFGTATRAELNKLYGCATSATQPSITITSPKSGESWQIGSTQSINWNVSQSADGSNSGFDISVASTQCVNPTTGVATCDPAVSYAAIAVGVSSNPYQWQVGDTQTTNNLISGSYIIKVCETGSNVCGISNVFSIVAPATK